MPSEIDGNTRRPREPWEIVKLFGFRVQFSWLVSHSNVAWIGGVGGLEYPLISGEFKVGLGLISGP